MLLSRSEKFFLTQTWKTGPVLAKLPLPQPESQRVSGCPSTNRNDFLDFPASQQRVATRPSSHDWKPRPPIRMMPRCAVQVGVRALTAALRRHGSHRGHCGRALPARLAGPRRASAGRTVTDRDTGWLWTPAPAVPANPADPPSPRSEQLHNSGGTAPRRDSSGAAPGNTPPTAVRAYE